MEEIETLEIINSLNNIESQQVEIQEILVNQGELIKGTNSLLLVLVFFIFVSFVYKLVRCIF